MSSTQLSSGRPEPGEFGAHAQAYIDRVEGDDAVAALVRQRRLTRDVFERFGESGADLTYGAGKWTLRQILGHLADDERIFAYRALCIARGDERPLAGFDENEYAREAGFENRGLEDLLTEYESVREASVTLFRGLGGEAWLRSGVVDGYPASVRGLAFHIAGHELHHLRFIDRRYVPLLGTGGAGSGGGRA